MLASARNSRRSILPALASSARAFTRAGISLAFLLRSFIDCLHFKIVLPGTCRAAVDDESAEFPETGDWVELIADRTPEEGKSSLRRASGKANLAPFRPPAIARAAAPVRASGAL